MISAWWTRQSWSCPGLGRDRHHIARVGEEVQPERSLDGGAIETLGPAPVEVAHGAEAAQAAAGQAALEAAVLFDLASEAPDFCDFRASAGRFFEETDAETVAEWEAAREDVRAGKTTIPPRHARQEVRRSPGHLAGAQ